MTQELLIWATGGSWLVTLGLAATVWYYRRKVAEVTAAGVANLRELVQRRAQVKILRSSLARARDASLKEFSDATKRRLEQADRIRSAAEAVRRAGDGWSDLSRPGGVPPGEGGGDPDAH